MTDPALCTDEEIAVLVHAFYGKARLDPELGPIFNAHVADWNHHLGQITDFWSGVLRGTGRFTGAPMPKHMALPDLTAALFQRWLALFRETAAEQPNRAMADRATMLAQRVANSLWYGYQINRHPETLPSLLPATDPARPMQP
ncbi:MAG: group III truncated hemoglobin [Burkholderiales bacterium]|nr:group III truncated hemoglobin [Burkholderiales bacterium]